jgi:tetratricopeptide (TPR) repeat protein
MKTGQTKDAAIATGICVLLVMLVLAVFGQTVGDGFVNFDDDQYVFQNAIVSKGLSPDGIEWAFTHVHSNNWHPLTTLLHMLDCQVYGLWAGGHHLTNVILHAAGAVLLFFVLMEMTGALWRSGFVAAVFAIHPLRVESVAWVSELKDVLSGVFFMLTLWAYARYARRPGSRGRYAMVMLWLALGLMSKPMLVTVPFVLLLLDYWPLGRFENRSQLPALLREKIPLFALSALSCVATVIAQKQTIQTIQSFPLSLRVGNALVAYVVYLEKLIWPSQLAVLYPFLKDGWPAWEVFDAILLLAGLTVGAWLLRRKEPSLLVGWLWYLGMLAPVIGILQVGDQAYADRYTYLPQIGLCLAGTWMAADWAGQRLGRQMALGAVALAILCVLPVVAFRQTTYWHDDETLWTHALECTRGNFTAHNDLGNDLLQQGRTEEAIAQYREALEIDPAVSEAHNDLGFALFRQGRTEEAVAEYRAALQINPAYAQAQINLGNGLLRQGRIEEGIAAIGKALELEPGNAAIETNLAWMLATTPQMSLRDGARAVQLAAEACESSGGNNPTILRALAAAYAQAGQFPNAVQTGQKALQLAEAQSNADLASALSREIKLYESGQSYRKEQ